MATPCRYRRLRIGLALLRLILLYGILNVLLLTAGLAWHERLELGPGLNTPLPSKVVPAAQPWAGINVDLERHPSPARRQQALQQLRRDGFTWVRLRLDWSRLEPLPGVFDWESSDGVLADLVRFGLEPVVVLDGSPAWARSSLDQGAQDNPFAPPADPDDFARFAAALAERYGHWLRFYQIWDEPNIAPHWGNRHIEPTGYARLLAAASSALRQADPDAVLILAALAPTVDRGHTAIDESFYLQRLYAAGAAPHFDVAAIQPFGFGHAPDDCRPRPDVLNFCRAILFRRAMQAAGDGTTPIWAVRYGWNTHLNSPWGTVSHGDQARLAAEARTYAQAHWPWLTAMAWAIDQPAAAADDPAWGFARLGADGSETPLALALEAANRAPQETGARTADAAPKRQAPMPAFGLILAAIVLALWRSIQAARFIPWRTLLNGYGRLAPGWRLAGWGALLLVYHFATWPPLLGLCWLLAAVWLAARPATGLWLAAMLLPFHYHHKELHLVNDTLTVAPAQAVLISLLVGIGIRYLAASTGRPGLTANHTCCHLWFDGANRLALGWLAISLAASANVWHWPGYWSGLWNLVLAPLLLYGLGRRLLTTGQRRRQLGLAILAGGTLAAAVGLVQWFQGGGTGVDGVRRLTGLFFSPNQTALYLERVVFLGLAGAVAVPSRRQRIALLAASTLVATALALTASRGAWLLGLPIGALAFLRLAQQPGTRSAVTKKWRWAVGVGLGTVGTAGGVLWPEFGERLTNQATVLQRLHVWQGALAMAGAFPVFGAGPGGFPWRYPAYMVSAAASEPNLLHAHNVWLEFATGWGLLGLLWLSGLLWLLWRQVQSFRHGQGEERWLSLGLLAGMVAALAHAQVDTFMGLGELAGWNWLALSALVSGQPNSPLRQDKTPTPKKGRVTRPHVG